eukprot:2859040-Lingulodinium_polyedra.AAC.1
MMTLMSTMAWMDAHFSSFSLNRQWKECTRRPPRPRLRPAVELLRAAGCRRHSRISAPLPAPWVPLRVI